LDADQNLALEHLASACDESGRLDPERAKNILTWVREARQRLENLRNEHPGAAALRSAFVEYATARDGARLRSTAARDLLAAFVRAHGEFDARRSALVDALHLDQDIAFGPASDDRWVERVAARAERHQRERERLRSWTAWLRAAGTARQRGLP